MIYSGNKLFNTHNGVSLILLFFLSVLISGGAIITVAFILVWIYFLASGSYYFELKDDQLIVRNYIIPFIKTRYNLADIIKIELTGTSNRDTSMATVKIYDNKGSAGFAAASLKLSDWQNLVTDLTHKKIAVTVTAIKLVNKIGMPEN